MWVSVFSRSPGRRESRHRRRSWRPAAADDRLPTGGGDRGSCRSRGPFRASTHVDSNDSSNGRSRARLREPVPGDTSRHPWCPCGKPYRGRTTLRSSTNKSTIRMPHPSRNVGVCLLSSRCFENVGVCLLFLSSLSSLVQSNGAMAVLMQPQADTLRGKNLGCTPSSCKRFRGARWARRRWSFSVAGPQHRKVSHTWDKVVVGRAVRFVGGRGLA